ncbi:hypothetical protein [Geothrix paludis]|uniref:hypothetical protein n=1 Tax=Geothrix paludis TaxID=2922722 RepID=UPI001FABA406|nr:hypothetical protein [Geothrix paludis]
MRTPQPSPPPAEYSQLTLQNYLIGTPAMTAIFVRSLALRLEEFIPHYHQNDARMVPGISAAVATLRNQRPLGLTWALLKGNDKRVGRFSLGLGCPVGFPFHLYVDPYPDDLSFPPTNKDGRVIFGLRRGRLNAIPADFDIAMEVITGVLSNGGLYGASHREAPCIFSHRDEVDHG